MNRKNNWNNEMRKKPLRQSYVPNVVRHYLLFQSELGFHFHVHWSYYGRLKFDSTTEMTRTTIALLSLQSMPVIELMYLCYLQFLDFVQMLIAQHHDIAGYRKKKKRENSSNQVKYEIPHFKNITVRIK